MLANRGRGCAPYHRADAVERHAVDQQVSQGAVQHYWRQEPVPLPLLRDRRCQLQCEVERAQGRGGKRSIKSEPPVD